MRKNKRTTHRYLTCIAIFIPL